MNAPSKIKQKDRLISMTSLTLKNLWTVYISWPDFCFDFAWNFESFESAEKIDVCKLGFNNVIIPNLKGADEFSKF